LADGTTEWTQYCLWRSVQPQWSPSLADGTTTVQDIIGRMQNLPQWSPSLADGTTERTTMATTRDGRAAMEPVLGGRDDPRP